MKKYVLAVYLFYHRLMIQFCWLICSVLPIDPRKAVFSNFNGGGYGDNPAFIAEELLRRKSDCRIYWVSANRGDRFPEAVRRVRPNTPRFVYHMSTAGVWVDNTRKLYKFRKKRQQFYIQTWHGGPGLKRVEGDCMEALGRQYISYAKKDSEAIDLFLSCCRWCTELYRRSFWYQGEILERGIPKSDLYFTDRAFIREKVLAYFGCTSDTKLALYAPTYRGDQDTDALYSLDYEKVLRALEDRFPGKWKILVHLHPNVNPAAYPIPVLPDVADAGPYPYMQELLAGCDVLFSDYSGCAFDFLLMEKPCFLYAEDAEEMERNKGFYFRPEELPFPFARTGQELLGQIRSFSQEAYLEKCGVWLSRIGYFDTGHASEAAAERIEARIQRKEKRSGTGT